MHLSEASIIRRRTDLVKLRALQAKTPKLLEILKVTGNPFLSIIILMRIPTARNSSYPNEKQDVSEVQIDFPERYPTEQPMAKFTTPIFNPNVYPSGKWCIGSKWNVMEFLDLFVKRMMQVVALDPKIVYPQSPANGEAARWYMETIKKHPELFPSIPISELVSETEKPKITWKSIK